MNCIQCQKEFVPSKTGLEQKYCSSSCRHLAYRNRKENKMNETINELKQKAENSNSIVPSKIIGIESNGNTNHLQFNNVWGSLLKGNYYELKVETLEERIKEKNETIEELKKEIMILENQIESLEDELQEGGNEQGGIGSIAKEIMSNPVGAVTMVKGLVDVVKEIFVKPPLKTQPQSKTS